MSTMTGADADELDRAAGELRQSAQQVGRIRTTVRSQVHSTPWHGRSADRFRQQWDSTYTRSMLDAEHFLREATTTLQLNAEQQRRASGAGGGGGSTQSASTASSRSGLSRLLSFGDQFIESLDKQMWLGLIPAGLSVVLGGLQKSYGKALFLRDATFLNFKRYGAKLNQLPGPLRAAGRAFDIIGGASSAYQLARAVQQGDVDTSIRRGLDLAWLGASRWPLVAAGKTSWDVGWSIGTELREVIHADEATDYVVDDYLRRTYGTNPTTSQVKEFSTRYDGPKGLFRLGGDWAASIRENM